MFYCLPNTIRDIQLIYHKTLVKKNHRRYLRNYRVLYFSYFIFYLNCGPAIHTTKVFLIPLVTGVTLCKAQPGNAAISPFFFSTTDGSLLFIVCSSPPSYSVGSDNDFIYNSPKYSTTWQAKN